MKKVLLYPLWLRLWHWFNAFLFLLLIVSGISMHYSSNENLFMPFDIAMKTHNIAGILLSLIYLFYAISNLITGNIKHYIPSMKNIYTRLFNQAKYYLFGVFKGEPHPYHTTAKMKFNPLQQLSYFGIMFFMMPIIVVSGWLLLFPELAPENVLGMGGVWPMAIAHIVVGFFLSVFMFGHIYLATHGDKVSTNFISMFNGYHHVHEIDHDVLIVNTGGVTEYNDDSLQIDTHEDYKVDTEGQKDYNPETKIIRKD